MAAVNVINGPDPARIPEKMKQFFLKIFTWWNGQTFGTQLVDRALGELVGEDEEGNRYYRTKAARSIRRSASSGAG